MMARSAKQTRQNTLMLDEPSISRSIRGIVPHINEAQRMAHMPSVLLLLGLVIMVLYYSRSEVVNYCKQKRNIFEKICTSVVKKCSQSDIFVRRPLVYIF